ncbi:MAG: hypothetical protein QOH95_2400 [Gaiellaceae bacterium]|jgi:hypothetical protein|nr:hypothetical protein [Gaiellaceae bacterium]
MRSRILLAVGVLAVFALGVALGQALSDNPRPGGQQSLVRTLRPLPLAPAARETVTITVQNK